MPATTYMVVDPRHDHSLRIPRPDRSVALGTPNACNGCHQDRDAAWAAAATRRWNGEPGPGFQDFAVAFHGAENDRPGALPALVDIAVDRRAPVIVRASALERLAAAPTSAAAAVARDAAADAAPLVRLGAVRLAEVLPPTERLAIVAPLLGDEFRAVRIESARVLAAVPAGALTPGQSADWERATGEYVASLAYNADRPEARVALGTFHGARGRYAEAQAAFAGAIAMAGEFIPAYLNAADAYRAAGDEAAARRALEAGLARDAGNAALHHALGLALARQQQPEPALAELAKAAARAPDDRRYAYVLGVALNSYGQTSRAIAVLERAAARWPADRDILIALATMQRDAGNAPAARRAVAALAAAHPDDPDVGRLLGELE
jgi:tetratricopeptide (TPR) repeat protein